MFRFIIKILSTSVAVLAAAYVLKGVHVQDVQTACPSIGLAQYFCSSFIGYSYHSYYHYNAGIIFNRYQLLHYPPYYSNSTRIFRGWLAPGPVVFIVGKLCILYYWSHCRLFQRKIADSSTFVTFFIGRQPNKVLNNAFLWPQLLHSYPFFDRLSLFYGG